MMIISNQPKFRGLIIFLVLIPCKLIFAGPPFNTDDPEPVEFMHWEFYMASVMHFNKPDADATLPHFETNYGIIPNVQAHLLIPMDYNKTGSLKKYSFGSIEIGAKYRFYSDSTNLQIGTFPLIEIPTHPGADKFSAINFQFFLPLWLQKSWGNLTTYGGAGIWYNRGKNQQNWIYAGWEWQFAFSELFTGGGELYYHTPSEIDGKSDSGFNIGGFLNLTDNHHIIFSLGSSLTMKNSFTGYLGYLFTI